jgi:hypothetical protein
MECDEFYDGNRDLMSWSLADQFLAWTWFWTVSNARPSVTGHEIATYYASIDLKPPGLIQGHGAALELEGKVVRVGTYSGSSTGYRLERRTREELDKKFSHCLKPKEHKETVVVRQILDDLQHGVTKLREQKYLNEAMICLRNEAFRAAIVMGWNLTYDHLCQYLVDEPERLANFNQQQPVWAINKRDDFANYKESVVIQRCKAANLIDKNQLHILEHGLTWRNMAAHPSDTDIGQIDAEHVVKTLVKEVIHRCKLN